MNNDVTRALHTYDSTRKHFKRAFIMGLVYDLKTRCPYTNNVGFGKAFIKEFYKGRSLKRRLKLHFQLDMFAKELM